jgi:outer membrane lipoprotein carrier protein
MISMRRWILAAAAAVLTGAAPAGQALPAAADLARQLQARYDTVRDFRARFSQTYDGGVLQLTSREEGELLLKKPGRLRMRYTSPEEKVFVADGERFYSYFPESRTGSVRPLPPENEASTAVLFLAGRGSLVRDFTASLAPEQPDGEWHLTLVPRTRQPDYRSLTLMVDRRTLQLRGFSQVDHQGGTTTTRLSQMTENVGLSDREFQFSFPRNVTLIDG